MDGRFERLKNWALGKFGHFLEFKIPLAQIQQEIETEFPVERNKYSFSMTLFDPVVRLDELANRIGVELTIAMRAPFKFNLQWRGLFHGRLEYRRKSGEFYIVNMQIQKIGADGLPSQYKNIVLSTAEKLLDRAMAEAPIYQLDRANWQHSIAKLLVKSVVIKQDGILVEMSF